MSQTTLEITATTFMVASVGSFEWLVLAVNSSANEPEEARYLTDHFGLSALPIGFNPSNVVGRLEIWRDYRGKDWDEYLRGDNLYVAPDHRRRGIATQLCKTFVNVTGLNFEAGKAQSEVGSKFWKSIGF